MKAPEGGVVTSVVHGSLAEEAGIEPGDTIIEIDGRVLRDAVDYQFFAAEPEITARFRKADGSEDLVLFEKDPDEDLGLAFERATWDGVQVCNNTCFFCFLKGLPKGLRKPLYLKDDDYRLSFLHGNFVTLTNLTDDDWTRLEEQRLSPLNVSVHATEVELRRKLLGNPRAPDVVAQLERLRDLGLRCHTQIVLTPGVNDGAALERSLTDLTALYPTVQTVSVVPVGASPRLEEWSRERDGIELVAPERDFARGLITMIRRFQRACEEAYGHSVVQCSDEYYLAGGRPLPAARRYDGFPQYENGIGMVRTLLDDWTRLRRRLRANPAPELAGKRVVIACGRLIGPVLTRPDGGVRRRDGPGGHRPSRDEHALRGAGERERAAERRGLRADAGGHGRGPGVAAAHEPRLLRRALPRQHDGGGGGGGHRRAGRLRDVAERGVRGSPGGSAQAGGGVRAERGVLERLHRRHSHRGRVGASLTARGRC